MIPREEHFVAIEQHLVAARVSRRGDEQNIIIELQRVYSRGHALDAERRGVISLVHHARAPKMRRKLDVVRDVVAVREKHQAHAAHLLDALHQRRGKARRIH